MTARDYPCPDCESWKCGGLGCIGRVRMETWPFAKKGVCRVPSTDKPKRYDDDRYARKVGLGASAHAWGVQDHERKCAAGGGEGE